MASLGSRLRSAGTPGQASVLYWCPGCDRAHAVRVSGSPPVWAWDGDVEAPTFDPSVLIRVGPEVCHSFIRKGVIQFLDDCTHHLRGQHVPMPDWKDA